jgi:hypothetical protein
VREGSCGKENAFPVRKAEGRSVGSGFGSWTILTAGVRTPGFASPPHDGFAFVGPLEESGSAVFSKTWTSRQWGTQVAVYVAA